MPKLEWLPKQVQFMQADADEILFGGSRGPGKSLGNSGKMALDVCEWWTERQMKLKKIDPKGYRTTKVNGKTYYFKYLIDYRDYMGVIIRKTEPELMSNSKVECDKIYPMYGGRYLKAEKKYVFPSKAQIWLRPCGKKEHEQFFIGSNFQRVSVEELTAFTRETIDVIKSCNRSTNPNIPARFLATTNPGLIGHLWVKERYVDVCPALPDGDRIYLEKYDISYQPLKGGKPYKDKVTGKTRQFIPALVFDNPYLVDQNESYVRYLMGLNTILKEMWLFGNWNVFAGQFFDMWDESKHVMPECEFYSADKEDRADLVSKRLNFDWSNFRLYRSYDYGYAEKSAWACGAYAVHNESNRIIKFAEIVKSKLTASMQAKYVNEFFKTHYNLNVDDFEMEIADPKSFWQKMDSGDGFVTAWDFYVKEGIHLIEGINAREQGAMAMLEVLRLQDDDLPQMRYLSCCEDSKVTIPNLPADPKNPNDIDTKANDHCVSPETLIWTTSGLKRIDSLVGQEGYCLGWNGERIGVTKFWNVQQTRKDAELWELGLDDGGILRATPDHQIMLRDGTYKELRDLSVDESLMPIYVTQDGHGHNRVNLNNSGNEFLHRVSYNDINGELPEDSHKWIVHHKDQDKTNNDPYNLKLMTRSEHTSWHVHNRPKPSQVSINKMKATMQKQLLNKDFLKRKQAHCNNIRPLTKKWHASEEGRKWHSEHAKENWVSKKKIKQLLIKQCIECGSVYGAYYERAKYCSDSCKALHNRHKREKKYGMTDKKRYEHNHKVAYIKRVENIDTYDMTTEFGNFATDKIIIHNSYDADRYFVMKVKASGVKFSNDKKIKGWRSKLSRKSKENNVSWRVA